MVVLSGCSASTLRRVNRIGFAVSSAVMLCDTSSTIEMSDGGKWDRTMGDGILREQNPLLGSTPSVAVLGGAAAVDVGINAAIYQSRLPEWAKASWFGAVTLIEGVVIANNARFAGVCGVGRQISPPSESARL
jgi:hypothetical protein